MTLSHKGAMYMNIKQSVIETVTDEQGKTLSRQTNQTLTWGDEPPYIKLYLQDIMYFTDMPQQFAGVLYALLKRMSYASEEDGMCVYLVPHNKKAICTEVHWENVKSLDNALGKLCQANLLKRIARSVYQFNPNLFGKGDWQDIAKLRMDISYDVSGRTFKTFIEKATNINEDTQKPMETIPESVFTEMNKNIKKTPLPEQTEIAVNAF